jgi:hypothetical protein
LYVLVLLKCLYLALHYSVMLGENCMYLAVPRDLGWYINGAYVLLNSSLALCGSGFFRAGGVGGAGVLALAQTLVCAGIVAVVVPVESQ